MRLSLNRIISLCLAVCLTFALSASSVRSAALADGEKPSAPGTETTDLPPEETTTEDPAAEPAVTPIRLRQDHFQFMQGGGDRHFYPGDQLTRAQAVQMLYNLIIDAPTEIQPMPFDDVEEDAWYALPVSALYQLGILDRGYAFFPNATISRAAFIDMLIRLQAAAGNDILAREYPAADYSDVPETYWASSQIAAATALGWVNGLPGGVFKPKNALSRAEGCAIFCRMLNRTGDAERAKALLTFGLYTDVSPDHWAGPVIVEASVSHTPGSVDASGETWSDGYVPPATLTAAPGFHWIGDDLYYADRYGRLAVGTTVGAYTAAWDGVLTQTSSSYQMSYVPYISQVDNLNAWVGCEPVSSLMGLKAKGYAADVSVRTYLADLPRTSSNPEKGFVGDPYTPDNSKRTTIYPAILAQYANSYTNGDNPCADFRGASIYDLQRELLAGNCAVAYMTLWWAAPYYRTYNIEGVTQSLVRNNHAVLVYGYDPDRGYLISDPYNLYNRNQVYQYWEDASTFERIWNERQVGMVIR